MATLVADLSDQRIRHVVSDGRGIALATNAGLHAATNEWVLVTHDDCTVAEDWVRSAAEAMQEAPDGMVTGRVLPVGDPAAVPSIRTETEPEEWTGRLSKGALWPANMAVNRDAILSMGGFDERLTLRWAAEDNDLCYRWISLGRRLRYIPQMVVWHHDWRSPQQLRNTYISYAKGQGAFYAKHLHAGDRRVLRFIVSDLILGVRSVVAAPVRRRPRWQDPRRALPLWLPVGLAQGWRESRRLGSSRTADRSSSGLPAGPGVVQR